MKAALAKIRKALLAGAGALVTGLGGIATTDNLDVSKVTANQVSTVLFFALATAVGTFAVTNRQAQEVITTLEHTVADAGGKAVVGVLPDVAAAVHSVLTPALGTLLQDLVAVGQIPLPVPIDPATYGSHAADPGVTAGTRIG